MRSILIIVIISTVMSLPVLAHEPAVIEDHISVQGVGEIEQEPDQAILNISITAQKPTLVEAKREADKKYSAVLKHIKEAKIDDKNIKATRINAQPQYQWSNNKRVYKGEKVSRSLSITINDLDKVPNLMQAIVEGGVSTIDGINTGFQNRSQLTQQALGLAADDAKSKAEFLAERLGRSLGQAYLITEHNNAPVTPQRNLQMMSRAAAVEDAAPPEMFGTQKIRATVNVSFNLL